MTPEWTVTRVRNSTVERIEKMVSKEQGFDLSLTMVLNDYDKLIAERIVQPEENLTPLDESNETIYPISPDFKEESINDHEEIENRLTMVENDIIAINKDRTTIEKVLNTIISRLRM